MCETEELPEFLVGGSLEPGLMDKCTQVQYLISTYERHCDIAKSLRADIRILNRAGELGSGCELPSRRQRLCNRAESLLAGACPSDTHSLICVVSPTAVGWWCHPRHPPLSETPSKDAD